MSLKSAYEALSNIADAEQDCFFRAKSAVEEQFSGKFRFKDNGEEIHASMDDFYPGYKKTNKC